MVIEQTDRQALHRQKHRQRLLAGLGLGLCLSVRKHSQCTSATAVGRYESFIAGN